MNHLQRLNELRELFNRESQPQWPWPTPSTDQIKALLADMQTMNQRLQSRIDELNLRLIHLEEIVRDFNADPQE